MIYRLVTIWITMVVGLSASACTADAQDRQAPTVAFSTDIQPLLAKHCLLCHGPDEAEAGLRLDVPEQAYAMLDSDQRAIVPGDAQASELLHRVTAEDPHQRMPPDGPPLSAQEIELLRQWIEQGAHYEPHWAYRPVEAVTLPEVKHEGWVRNPVDAFVLAQLEPLAVSPSPEAGRATLIRRLHYDLIGLPPAPQEVDAFVNDDAVDAYERLVDSLLDSEHFGERWGRHWLDMARYADSDGYEKDRPRPNAWRYRDWVIEAINRDMPLDQFTIEQLAGDLLPDASPMQKLATAFHRQTLTNTEGGVDQEEFRVEATFDRAETTAAIWMGLTLTCARCHTHKYDQISHHEYYQLFAFFNNADETDTEVPTSDAAVIFYQQQMAQHDAKIVSLTRQYEVAKKELQPQIDAWEQETLAALDQYPSAAALAKRLQQLKDDAPESPLMSVPTLAAKPRTTRLLDRGDFLQPADEVTPGGLEVLAAVHPLRSRHAGQGPDRLDLARWLVDPNHPLTSRVAVNHVWARLFGSGIVPTVNDFGVRGEPPTHPELLQWLAWNFPRQMQWSRKALIRTIVTSATYRQSSHSRPELQTLDPTNRLLARQNRLRVEAEIVRDLHLAAGDLLSRRIGGPSVFPPLPPGVAELSYANNFKWNTSSNADRYRRGLYTFFKRTSPHPTLISFDCPDSNTTRLQREASNTPLQALVTLNNDVFTEAAQGMARRVLSDVRETTDDSPLAPPGRGVITRTLLSEGGDDDTERLRYALRLCIARVPDDSEIHRFHDLLNVARDHYQNHAADAKSITARHAASKVSTAENAAWVATLRMMMNLDEFIVRD